VAQGVATDPTLTLYTDQVNQTKQMTVTLTANYRETLNAHTVDFIDERIDENYALDDMLEFIDAHSEDDFCNYYEEYVRCGEAIGYEAVDALIEEMGDVSYIECCDERYQGSFDDEAEFAEQFTSEVYGDVPSYVVVDWEATWDQNLRYDFTACSDGSTYRPCHIFRDH
jgi:hypothetical protein